MKLFFSGVPGLLIAGSLALGCAMGTQAAGVADEVSVIDPYVRAVPPVAETTAAFMQFLNAGTAAQFLVDAATPAAGKVELHTHIHDEGVMRMRRVPHIELPPNKTVSLEPGADHIMLFELSTELKPGDRIPLTLTFGDGSSKQISAEVRTVESRMHH
jgi:copper(I)-binding protein